MCNIAKATSATIAKMSDRPRISKVVTKMNTKIANPKSVSNSSKKLGYSQSQGIEYVARYNVHGQGPFQILFSFDFIKQPRIEQTLTCVGAVHTVLQLVGVRHQGR
jgi:hypothetical protein